MALAAARLDGETRVVHSWERVTSKVWLPV
jgi:hypothetical protein